MRYLLSVALMFIMFSVQGQEQKKPLSPKAVAKSEHIEITYGQPSKRDRVIFGGLVPFDSVWRTGANEATEIKFNKDAVFGGKKVKAGTYSLFTIPSQKSWEIILNKQLGQWGAYEYEKYKRRNVLKTKANVYTLSDVKEKFTITIVRDTVRFEWDKTGVAVPVKF